MTPEIPKGWECALLGDDATHVTLNGKIFELISGVCFCPGNVNSTIYAGDFDALGITPVRKVRVEPIEFTVGAIMDSGHIYGTKVMWAGVEFNSAPEEWIGKTFREVTD